MIPAEAAILAMAVLLDLALGDPRWLPHPVVLIGRLVSFFEIILRKAVSHEQSAGILLLVAVTASTATLTWLLIHSSAHFFPLAGFLAAVFCSYTCLSARSLHLESLAVANAMAAGNRDEAKHYLSRIVGRDTATLDDVGIWRALVETVAENTSDGIIAPLFWLTIGGPVAGMTFKAVNTLDSMVGYKNERYLRFGWASARMDDLLNLVPARLTAMLMILAAPLAGLSLQGALKITLRDRLKHPSPNSGHPEAAAAGALGVQLGGLSWYGGRKSWKENIGEPIAALDGQAYKGMIRLMYITALIMSAACISVSTIVLD